MLTAWVCKTVRETRLLVFNDGETAAKSNRMYWAIVRVDSTSQCKWIMTQTVLQKQLSFSRKGKGIFLDDYTIKYKTEGRETHKQAAT